MAACRFHREIIAHIIYFLAQGPNEGRLDFETEEPISESLATYATVSQEWRAQVERRTFRVLVLTPERLSTALTCSALLTSVRLSSIRKVVLRVVLEPYDDAARAHVESDAERLRNNVIFTQAIRDTFRLLARIPDGNAEIALWLAAVCQSDPQGGEFLARQRRRQMGQSDDILRTRYESSYLELIDGSDDPWSLPKLPMIAEFKVDALIDKRFIAPRVCCIITSSLPRVRKIHWELWDNEKKDHALRRRLREDFAKTIPFIPSTVENVFLKLHYFVSDHYATPQALLLNPYSIDPLSAALRVWTHKLRVFTAGASLSNDFFFSSNRQETSPPPEPSHITDLSVMLADVTPAGCWLLGRHPAELEPEPDDLAPVYTPPDYSHPELLAPDVPAQEDFDSWIFRMTPDPPLWNAILLAVGHAVSAMPALRHINVCTGLRQICSVDYNVRKRTVTFDATPALEPDDEVLRTWKESTRTQLDDGELQVQVTGEEHGMTFGGTLF